MDRQRNMPHLVCARIDADLGAKWDMNNQQRNTPDLEGDGVWPGSAAE